MNLQEGLEYPDTEPWHPENNNLRIHGYRGLWCMAAAKGTPEKYYEIFLPL